MCMRFSSATAYIYIRICASSAWTAIFRNRMAMARPNWNTLPSLSNIISPFNVWHRFVLEYNVQPYLCTHCVFRVWISDIGSIKSLRKWCVHFDEVCSALWRWEWRWVLATRAHRYVANQHASLKWSFNVWCCFVQYSTVLYLCATRATKNSECQSGCDKYNFLIRTNIQIYLYPKNYTIEYPNIFISKNNTNEYIRIYS